MLYLVSNYNGYAESKRRISTARYKLSHIFYKNKITFNFDTFSTKLKDTFDTMEKYGEVGSDQERFSTFL